MRRLLTGLATAFALWSVPAHAVTIGVSLSSDTNPFYVLMRKGIEQRASELGWSVRFVSANESPAAQVSGVEDLIAQGVDGILISPIDGVAARPAFHAAAMAHIPIMSVARTANSPDETAAVAMDEIGIGRDIGSWLAKAIGGKGSIAMLAGPSGAETFRNLAKGFEESIAKSPDIKIVFRKDIPLTREDGLRTAQDALVAHPDIVGIYGGNDETALGAVEAVRAAGKIGEIVVTGLNGVPPAVAAVKKGDLGLTVELNPVAWGALGIDTMARWLKGEHDFKRVDVGYKLIDKK